jgi:uncharacterized protein YbgA (DUF1722 family)/uncharacterized protein YbbK (DUF523 family)
MATPSPDRIRLLASACLLGEEVRYDGRHKLERFLAEELGPHVAWLRVCPESDSGMPVPRPPMRLEGDPRAPRLVGQAGVDLTRGMRRFIRAKLEELSGAALCGFVCKQGSPSCGLVGVPIHRERGAPRSGAGLFTRAFTARFPLVPVEDEDRLRDPRVRASFLERVFCRLRWLELAAGGRDRGRLVEFHADHKFLLLAHGRTGYAELGRLVAAAKGMRLGALFAAYERLFMAALARPVTPEKRIDVLQHMLGFFKGRLSRGDRAELVEAIAAFRDGRLPFSAPLALVERHACEQAIAYLTRQAILAPYPAGLRASALGPA